MNLSRSTGWILLAIGVVLLLVTFFASDLGLGGTQYGIRHILALVVGVVLVAVGLYGAMRPAATGIK